MIKRICMVGVWLMIVFLLNGCVDNNKTDGNSEYPEETPIEITPYLEVSEEPHEEWVSTDYSNTWVADDYRWGDSRASDNTENEPAKKSKAEAETEETIGLIHDNQLG